MKKFTSQKSFPKDELVCFSSYHGNNLSNSLFFSIIVFCFLTYDWPRIIQKTILPPIMYRGLHSFLTRAAAKSVVSCREHSYSSMVTRLPSRLERLGVVGFECRQYAGIPILPAFGFKETSRSGEKSHVRETLQGQSADALCRIGNATRTINMRCACCSPSHTDLMEKEIG